MLLEILHSLCMNIKCAFLILCFNLVYLIHGEELKQQNGEERLSQVELLDFLNSRQFLTDALIQVNAWKH